jgi:hypothetical protein
MENKLNLENYIICDICGDLNDCNNECIELVCKFNNWIINKLAGNVTKCDTLNNEKVNLILNNNSNMYILNEHQIALIVIPETIDIFLKQIKSKTRNMIRKSKKILTFNIFNYNDYLEDIYNINTSLEIRQNKCMTETYLEYPKKRTDCEKGFTCDKLHKTLYYGAFKENILVGYVEGVHLNNLLVINKILGHGAYLNHGVMNGLINFLVEYNLNSNIKYINYLKMNPNKHSGTDFFKKNCGFNNYSCFFEINKFMKI